MLDNDVEMKHTMLQMIMDELPVEIDKLQQAVSTLSWQEAHEISHKLKSTLAFVGSPEMTKVNGDIMDSCKNRDRLDLVPVWMNTLAACVPVALSELQQAALSISSPNI
jgi:HPt (histidine-containing phosphotransfer) domain-containing protein